MIDGFKISLTEYIDDVLIPDKFHQINDSNLYYDYIYIDGVKEGYESAMEDVKRKLME